MKMFDKYGMCSKGVEMECGVVESQMQKPKRVWPQKECQKVK